MWLPQYENSVEVALRSSNLTDLICKVTISVEFCVEENEKSYMSQTVAEVVSNE